MIIIKISTKAKYYSIRAAIAVFASALAVAFLYIWFVYSSLPFISYWRTIWIETAMTTGSHHWLATSFIPKDIIDEVMANSQEGENIVGGMEYLTPNEDKSTSGDITVSSPVGDDILGQAKLKIGEKDYAGYTVLVNDAEQGIVVSEIIGSGYRGYAMLIDDPARVYLASTKSRGEKGQRILEYLSDNGAVAGINASGFMDHAGQGTGGDVVGISCSSGDYWGEYVNYYGSVVFTRDNKLVVGNISIWDNYNIRDGIQFGPVLIADGKQNVEGSAGYGIQPRTAIGQREDGAVMFLVIDGRDITWSVGCTVGDMAEIMMKYGVVNAACCDGGSSSIMAYNGEVLNRNSSANPAYGRRMPNAFLVRPK